MSETVSLGLVQFELVTPARVVQSEYVYMVTVPGGDGDFGVLPKHAPLLTTLRPGTIDIHGQDGKVKDRIFVEEGFAEVTPDRCTVLAEEAMRVDDIHRDFAESRLKKATDALMSAEEPGVRIGAERELRAAEAMVEAVDERDKAKQQGQH